jgi:prepilin peptidase CpaA
MNALPQQLVFAAASLLCAAIGSVQDVRERRIPNRLTGPAVVAGLALHAALGGWQGLGASALAGLIAGGLFLLFFLAGGMGAGDVKLMAAVGCIAGLAALPTVMLATAFAGALFAVAISLHRGRLRQTLRNVGELLLHLSRHGIRPHGELNLRNASTLRLPFALPIAAGCLFTLCTLAWGPHS